MPLEKMPSKMSCVIKFEFHVAMKGIRDWFLAKLVIEEFSVLKLTDTCAHLQRFYISYRILHHEACTRFGRGLVSG